MKIPDIDKVLIFGAARSGIGAANLLVGMGADVTVTDGKKKEQLNIEDLDPRVHLALGGHPEEIFEGVDTIIVSPGVPLDIEPLKNARAKGIEIIGELELAYRVVGGDKPFYAVTGTNGKSTTVTLLDEMLKQGGFKTVFGGNIGNAITGEMAQVGQSHCIVVEVSSFQLDSIRDFKPNIASILNITPDHLDRYHSMDEYRKSKERIFANQNENDFLVLNHDDAETMKSLYSTIRTRVFFFSRLREVKGIYLQGGIVMANFNKPSGLIWVNEIKIKGVHNLENAMAASAMALLAGVKPEAVRKTLMEFPGLEHRLEFVRELDGVKYYNDSKGTNVGAVLKSLEGFKEPVILIAGGRDKAGDFSLLKPLVKDKVRVLILIGEAKEKLNNALSDVTTCIEADDMNEAVELARSLARSQEAVLLSPACASFDMFRNFEDRGAKFKEAVRNL